MCAGCWAEYKDDARAVPPENTAQIIEKIDELYAQEDGGGGGPLHVFLDDFNVGHTTPYENAKFPWKPKTMALARTISELMTPLSEPARAAVLAVHYGYLIPENEKEN